MSRHLPALALALVVVTTGCASVGTERALDEAEAALVEAAPAGLELAPTRARYDHALARAYLDEARTRAGHGDWAQAERWAVKARKAAEAALRRIVGDVE